MIHLTSLDFEITDAIREEVESLQPLIGKFMPDSGNVRVTLSKSAPDVFHVHMQSHFLGEEIISHHESHNFHKALELCKDHFVKQVDKRKQKIRG